MKDLSSWLITHQLRFLLTRRPKWARKTSDCWGSYIFLYRTFLTLSKHFFHFLRGENGLLGRSRDFGNFLRFIVIFKRARRKVPKIHDDISKNPKKCCFSIFPDEIHLRFVPKRRNLIIFEINLHTESHIKRKTLSRYFNSFFFSWYFVM